MRVAVSVCPKCSKEFNRKVEEGKNTHSYTETRKPEYCVECRALVIDSPEEKLLQAIFGGGRDM